jgi:DNA-directed RNA polymerase sigma subunit (sigma70/sigma32)
VGAVMGFSRERARQVERDALAALRSPETRARLEGFTGEVLAVRHLMSRVG